jgi:hypothetical protein
MPQKPEMKLVQRFRRLSLWNKVGVVGAIASIIALLAMFFPFLAPDAPPNQLISSESSNVPALSINQLNDSTIVVGSENQVGNTLEPVGGQPSLSHETRKPVRSDFSSASVLAFEASDEEFGYAVKVEEAWPRSRVENVSAESSEAFWNALDKGCEIVHLSIGFDERALWFSETDIISTEQFRDMFLATGATRILILDGCGSFAIGKVLENVGLEYLIVALPDSPAASVFFEVDPNRWTDSGVE